MDYYFDYFDINRQTKLPEASGLVKCISTVQPNEKDATNWTGTL